MIKKKYSQPQDSYCFYKEMQGIKKITQDTIFHIKSYKLHKKYSEKKEICERNAHISFFKNHDTKKIITGHPVSYVRSKDLQHELLKLKNKQYSPKHFLDLHGLNKIQAKYILGTLFNVHTKKIISCFSIVHGHGKNILKNYIPIWLSQHPKTLAFYQVPQKFGSCTTIFGLLDNGEN